MFIKNAALLQDKAPPERESNARRHRDKMLEPRSPPRNGLFGKPRFLTHDSDPPEGAEAYELPPATSSPPAAPPLSSSPPPAEPEFPFPEPSPPLRQPPGSIDATVANANTITQAQPPAPTPIRTQVHACIPSSKSPSPMKLLPSSSLPDAFVPSSPVRLPDTDAITKALHESLTSLLGKRPIAEEDRDEAMRDAGGAIGAGAKKGKRVRPGSNVRLLCSLARRVLIGLGSTCDVARLSARIPRERDLTHPSRRLSAGPTGPTTSRPRHELVRGRDAIDRGEFESDIRGPGSGGGETTVVEDAGWGRGRGRHEGGWSWSRTG